MYKDVLQEVESVFAAKNKAVSATAIRLLERVFRAEAIPTDSNVNSGAKAMKALNTLLDDIRKGESIQMRVTVEGEKFLSDETLRNRAGGYVLTLRDVARLERDTARRLSELREKLQNIEAKIPHAQSESWRAILSETNQAFENVPL